MNTQMTMNRRDFLLMTGGTLCMAMLPCNKLAASDWRQSATRFPESTCEEGGQTAKRILIAYASRLGSTGDIAETIGHALCGAQVATDVLLIENVDDPGPYDAIILGSAIRAGKWLPEATRFVRNHQDTLSRMPVAYFTACMAMKDDTPGNRRKALAYLDPLRKSAPEVKPIDTGLFAGAVDYKKLSFIQRKILKAKEIPQGDFRDLQKIRSWALKLSPALLKP